MLGNFGHGRTERNCLALLFLQLCEAKDSDLSRSVLPMIHLRLFVIFFVTWLNNIV
jgi:hypothetical protein